MCRVRMVGYINNPNLIVLPLQTTCSVQLGRNLSASQRDCCHPAASMQPCHRQFRSSQAAPKHIFSNILAKAKRLMKSDCASARSSAILATLKEGISKLSGPRWFQKMDNLECGRSHVSEIKLKRTDTTLWWVLVDGTTKDDGGGGEKTYLDLSQKAKELVKGRGFRRGKKTYIPADGGRSWHPASLLAWAVTTAVT